MGDAVVMNRRDILKGIAALPAIGLINHSTAVASMPHASRKMPRHLFQLGLSTADLHALRSKYARDVDTILKAEELIPQDAVLEAVFECAGQDVMVFRWQHEGFHPIVGYDCISTCAPSDEWRKKLGI
jgi:hypothetical protein